MRRTCEHCECEEEHPMSADRDCTREKDRCPMSEDRDCTHDPLPSVAALFHAESDLNAMSDQSTLPFEIVLDSGAVDHVADHAEAPGYSVDSSGRSTTSFSAANGEPIENKGVMTLNLKTTEGHPIQSKFQVCEVSRPLWSVGKICDAGCTVSFDSKGATVKHTATGKNICLFERRRGLYVASLPLSRPKPPTNPEGARRQGFTRQD